MQISKVMNSQPLMQTNSTSAKKQVKIEDSEVGTGAQNKPIFLNKLRPEQAREFLLNHISRKLNTLAFKNPLSFQSLTHDKLGTQETLNEIKTNIQQALANKNTEQPTTPSLLAIDETKSQVSAGFKEAREILTNTDNDSLKTEIDEIEIEVKQFIDSLP